MKIYGQGISILIIQNHRKMNILQHVVHPLSLYLYLDWVLLKWISILSALSNGISWETSMIHFVDVSRNNVSIARLEISNKNKKTKKKPKGQKKLNELYWTFNLRNKKRSQQHHLAKQTSTIELETQSTASFNGDSDELPQNQLIGTGHERNLEVEKFSSKSKTLTFEFRKQVFEMLF